MKKLCIILALGLLVGCTATTTKTTKGTASRTKIVRIKKILTNIPLFPGLEYDTEHSFVYESGNIKAAVVTLEGEARLKDVVDFYKAKMVEEGWEPVSIFVYENRASMLFDSLDSSCNIEVQSNNSHVTVTIKVGSKSAVGNGK